MKNENKIRADVNLVKSVNLKTNSGETKSIDITTNFQETTDDVKKVNKFL